MHQLISKPFGKVIRFSWHEAMIQTSLTPTRKCQPASKVPDPVQLLRTATHELHQRLDQNLPLARENPGLMEYRDHISVLRDWQLALKPWLSVVLDNDWSLALIAQDLADLPRADSSSRTRPANLCMVRQFDDGSAAFCWGIAYVLEGSRLGGQVLHRRLSASLSPHPLRYLSASGPDGHSWPKMLAALRQHLFNEQTQAAGCHGAVAAFQLLIAQFKQENMLPLVTPSLPRR